MLSAVCNSQFIERFGDFKSNPKGLEITTIDQLFSVGSSKRVFQKDWKSSGVPFYRAREIVKLSEQGFVDNELFITESHQQKIREISQMAKKKKLTKAERKEARLRKGKQWLLTYTGSPKKMNKHYRERFHVDAVTAAKDLQELGVNYTQEQLDQIKQAEEQRLRQRRMEREAKERERLGELYEDCDGRFAFIAGYTDGGAPYGVMWEEVGIDPGLPFEEKVKLYHMQMLG